MYIPIYEFFFLEINKYYKNKIFLKKKKYFKNFFSLNLVNKNKFLDKKFSLYL